MKKQTSLTRQSEQQYPFQEPDFMDDSKPPEMHLKYQQFKCPKNYDNLNPTPWASPGQLSPKRFQINSPPKIKQERNSIRTIPVRSRLQTRKRKNPEQKPEQLKINSTFVQFRTTSSALPQRNNSVHSIETQKVYQPKIINICSKAQFEGHSKYDARGSRSLDKTPKMQYLQRKFRFKYCPSVSTGRSKSVRVSSNLNDSIFTRVSQRENHLTRSKEQKRQRSPSPNWHPLTVYRAYKEGNSIRIRKADFMN